MAAQDPGGGCREQFGSGVPSEVRGRALILLVGGGAVETIARFAGA